MPSALVNRKVAEAGIDEVLDAVLCTVPAVEDFRPPSLLSAAAAASRNFEEILAANMHVAIAHMHCYQHQEALKGT